jgi:signal transduction histidine kinase
MLTLIFLWFLLVNSHPAFNIMLGGLFSQLFLWLNLRWAIPFTLGISFLIFGMQRNWQFSWQSIKDPTLWMWLFVAATPILLALFIGAITNESERRQQLIQKLQAAQSDLAQSERRAGMLAERQRLAREIHDTLAQGFTSIVMHLEAAEQAIGQDDAIVQKHVDRARRTARGSLEQARRVVNDLMPEPLERASLPEAIARVAEQWSAQHDIASTTTCTGHCAPLPPEIEIILLRATQEALNNIAKHARASQATITLSYMPDVIMLDVQDDGAGMRDAAARGTGLTAMQQRLTAAGGSLHIETEPGVGTTLVLSIPLVEFAND